MAKRLTALFLCICLLAAQGQEAFAAGSTENEENLEIEESADSWRYSDGQVIDTPDTDSSNGLSTLTSTYSSWKASYGTSYYGITSGSSVTKVKVSGVMRVGIDVSKWQGTIDWEKVAAAGIDYAIIRCGYGSNSTSQDDEYFVQNVEGALENGIEIGIYLYSHATTTAKAASEAQHVLRMLDEANLTPGDVSLPVFLDMEDSTQGKLSAKSLGNVAETFCNAIAAEGYTVGIYSSLNWWTTKLTDSRFSSSGWFKWVARYPTSSSVTACGEDDADMWQFSSHGTVSGISGNVDMNFDYRGSGAYVSNTPTLSVKLSSAQTSVSLSWTTVTGASGYRIYRSTDGGSYELIAQVEGGSTKTYTDTVELNKTYKYKVKAYWAAADGTISTGDAGNAKSVDTTLEAPTVSLAILTTSGYCKLYWEQTAAAAGYEVYRSTDDGATYELIKTITDPTTVTCLDKTITAGKAYRYKVKAYAPSGTGTAKSKYSNVMKFSTTPSKVTISSAQKKTDGTIKLTWKKQYNVSGYLIYRSTDGGAYKLVKTITKRTTVSWTDTTTKAGRVYRYKVKSYATSGGKTVKGTASAAKKATAKPAKTSISSVTAKSKALKVSWKKVTGATGYTVAYRWKGSSTWHYVRVKSTSTTLSLKKGRTYYVKVRAYTTRNGTTTYAAWSSMKKKMTK